MIGSLASVWGLLAIVAVLVFVYAMTGRAIAAAQLGTEVGSVMPLIRWAGGVSIALICGVAAKEVLPNVAASLAPSEQRTPEVVDADEALDQLGVERLTGSASMSPRYHIIDTKQSVASSDSVSTVAVCTWPNGGGVDCGGFWTGSVGTEITMVDISGGTWQGITLPSYWLTAGDSALQIEYLSGSDELISLHGDSTFRAASVGETYYYTTAYIDCMPASSNRASHGEQTNGGAVAMWIQRYGAQAGDSAIRMSLDFNSGSQEKYWVDNGVVTGCVPTLMYLAATREPGDSVTIETLRIIDAITNDTIVDTDQWHNGDGVPGTDTLPQKEAIVTTNLLNNNDANLFNAWGFGDTSTLNADGFMLVKMWLVSDEGFAPIGFIPGGS